MQRARTASTSTRVMSSSPSTGLPYPNLPYECNVSNTAPLRVHSKSPCMLCSAEDDLTRQLFPSFDTSSTPGGADSSKMYAFSNRQSHTWVTPGNSNAISMYTAAGIKFCVGGLSSGHTGFVLKQIITEWSMM